MTASRPPRAGTLLPLGWWKDPRWQFPAAERDLFTRLLSYSADFLTDGTVPSSIVAGMAFAAVGRGGDSPGAAGDAAHALTVDIVGRGLLVFDGDRDSYVIPRDVYAIFNLTAAEVEAMKGQRAEAGRQRARSATRDPVTKRFKPADQPAGAGSVAGSGSQRQASGKASPSPVSRLPEGGTSSTGLSKGRRSIPADSLTSNGYTNGESDPAAVCLDCRRPTAAHAPDCPILLNPALARVVG
jgi:hypothetical protein